MDDEKYISDSEELEKYITDIEEKNDENTEENNCSNGYLWLIWGAVLISFIVYFVFIEGATNIGGRSHVFNFLLGMAIISSMIAFKMTSYSKGIMIGLASIFGIILVIVAIII